MKLDHVAVAVSSLKESEAVYECLGLTIGGREELPDMGIRVSFLKIGDTRLELLESMDPSSTVAKFLASRGPGLHHIAFEVEDIRKSLKDMKEKGYRLIDEEPKTGAGGKLVAFVHPRTTGGVLLELSQNP